MKNLNNITASWEANATEWISLLDRSGIASRKITNAAIIDFVLSSPGQNILDVGCGEGWLTRSLSEKGLNVTGIDATATLIKEAQTRSTNNFFELSYEQIIQGEAITGSPFDIIVFNYSLYEKELTGALLNALHQHLTREGRLIIQTVHPNFLIQKQLPYKSQWIEDAWKGLDGNFIKPHSWYARTMEDWIDVFQQANFTLERLKETTNSAGILLSVIFSIK